jgi:hypothetical protein
MARALTFPGVAARLAFVVPFVAFLPAACGGYDTIPFDDEDAATAADGSLADRSLSDRSVTDTSVADRTVTDTSAGDTSTDSRKDTSDAADAADAADASRDAEGGVDAGLDAADAADARDAADAGLDAADAADARDAADAADGAVLTFDPRLGSVVDFAVFAGSTVSNAATTLTTVTGDIGTYPDTTAIGVTPPVLVGAYHLGDTVAKNAAKDLLTAYNGLTPASMPGCTSLTGQDLGGKTLPPGIYCFATSAQLTGALVLDSGGNPNAEWFFQIGSTLKTGPVGASPASVTVIGASPCNVYWQVGSAATLATGTVFGGNILASSAITLVTGTTLLGRALAVNAGVTMDTNVVSIAACPRLPVSVDAGIPDADAGDAEGG